MAYTKLPKVRSDYVLGYQTLNIAKANQEAHRDAWLNKHGEEESIPGRPGNPARLLGHHSDDRIPRDVLKVRCESPGSFGAPQLSASESWFVGSPTRISAGQYFFPIRILSNFWATATPEGSASAVRWVRCLSYYRETTGTLPNGVFLFCNVISGGTFTGFDMNLTLTIYGYAPS